VAALCDEVGVELRLLDAGHVEDQVIGRAAARVARQRIELLEIRRGDFAPEADQGDPAALAQLHVEHRLAAL